MEGDHKRDVDDNDDNDDDNDDKKRQKVDFDGDDTNGQDAVARGLT